MKIKTSFFLSFFALIFIFHGPLAAQTEGSNSSSDDLSVPSSEKLVILWTSGDREVALKMVFMYTFNAQSRSWWEDITLIVWGPSAKLLTEDEELQEYLKKIMDAGVDVRACKGCSDQYGITEQLEALGITVVYIGKELTDYIREGREILTI